jgi:hypothetical protein
MVLTRLTRQHVSMEHRWGNRHDLRQSVRIATHSGLIGRGVIRDVSSSGAFVEALLPLKRFCYVKIQFNSALDGRPTTVEGQVVRKDATGFGIEWRELAPEIVAALLSGPARGSQANTPRQSPHLVSQRPATAVVLSRLPGG